jgi:predicted dehydrogenase
MPERYRVAIIGFAHMHINHVAEVFASHPRVDLVACADTTPLQPELREAPYTRAWNRKNCIARFGIPAAYADYRELLAQEKPDIVIVTCENAQHPDVVAACAAAGVRFCCVEKPMAASLPAALRMLRACRDSGTGLAVNWPIAWSPAVRKVKQLVDAGAIGRVLEVKWRAGHTGPLGPGARHTGVSDAAQPLTGPERAATWWHQSAAGGGALLDFTSYGCLLAPWFTGERATAVMAMRANLDSQYGDAEDNAAMLVRFPNALGLFEASFTTWHHGVPTGPIVYGTQGTLVVESRDGKSIVRQEGDSGQTTIHEPEPLPAGRDEIAPELTHHLDTGDPLYPLIAPGLNLQAMAILAAGVRSAAGGSLELVQDESWCIG